MWARRLGRMHSTGFPEVERSGRLFILEFGNEKDDRTKQRTAELLEADKNGQSDQHVRSEVRDKAFFLYDMKTGISLTGRCPLRDEIVQLVHSIVVFSGAQILDPRDHTLQHHPALPSSLDEICLR